MFWRAVLEWEQLSDACIWSEEEDGIKIFQVAKNCTNNEELRQVLIKPSGQNQKITEEEYWTKNSHRLRRK